jgi:hypothetical protein
MVDAALSVGTPARRRRKVDVICVSRIRRNLFGATGAAAPHPDCADPQSPAVGLWQFWVDGAREPMLVAKSELASLKNGLPLD